MKITYQISEIAPYINWAYFFHAWGMSGMPESEKAQLRLSSKRIPCLRQQQPGSDCLCLSDFIAPQGEDRVGLFATSVSHGLETDFDTDPYQKMMMQLLADRLAEATAERMHEEVRKHYWGYAKDENLSIPQPELRPR